MEEIRRFVVGMIKQTEEDLAFEKRSETEEGWLRFLEGKLQAFKLVQGFLEDLRKKREQLH
jgi:tryptophanyl-tRNA synthetase